MSRQNGDQEQSYFAEQRDILVQEIGLSLEQVLQNLNKLNRSIEGITAVGNEFSSVEALWSHFEGVMGKEAVDQKREEGTAESEAQSSTASKKV